MNPNKTAVICVIDKSGSMSSVKDDTIGSFNEFLLEQQKLEGECLLTLTLFSTDYVIVHKNVPVADVEPLTKDTYFPGGNTALIDAICRSIDEVGAELTVMPEDERPGKVIMMILTDGMENASKEYSHVDVKKKIATQKDEFSWEFIYLGADINSEKHAEAMGISAQHFCAYSATGAGTRKGMMKAGRAVSAYRSTGHVGDLKDK